MTVYKYRVKATGRGAWPYSYPLNFEYESLYGPGSAFRNRLELSIRNRLLRNYEGCTIHSITYIGED